MALCAALIFPLHPLPVDLDILVNSRHFFKSCAIGWTFPPKQ